MVQVHTDTASMECHMQVLADNWDEFFSKYSHMLDVLRVDYYGTPPERALAMDRQFGITFSVKPGTMPGFVRSPAGGF